MTFGFNIRVIIEFCVGFTLSSVIVKQGVLYLKSLDTAFTLSPLSGIGFCVWVPIIIAIHRFIISARTRSRGA
ncbi:hypothetical protein ANAPH2_00790 [Anaplasma phagocytophilum]|nr:hypothetical protein ANAPH2_00790 [Anaplasma phagocytophilum]